MTKENRTVEELIGLSACTGAVVWADKLNPRGFGDLWRKCDNPDWLLWGIIVAGVPPTKIRKVLRKICKADYLHYTIDRLRDMLAEKGRKVTADLVSDHIKIFMSYEEEQQDIPKVIRETISYSEVLGYYKKTKKRSNNNG
jgi:hypothetical protein